MRKYSTDVLGNTSVIETVRFVSLHIFYIGNIISQNLATLHNIQIKYLSMIKHACVLVSIRNPKDTHSQNPFDLLIFRPIPVRTSRD